MDLNLDKITGKPVDISYLECDLPPYLKESLDGMKKCLALLREGIDNLDWGDCWCDLSASINSAEVEQEITSEVANYLRYTYLEMKE